MIGQVRGKLIGKQMPDILVEVGGIGYEIQVPMTTLYQLPELGHEVTLLTNRKSTRLNSSHVRTSRMPSSA